MNRRLAITLRLLTIAAVALCLWWFVRKIDWDKLGDALRTAMVWPLVLAAVLNFVCLWGKAVCWRIMLAPKHHVKTFRLFRYTIAAFTASAIAPARAGEVLRVWILKRRDNVPAADTAAVAVAEKLLDGVSMLILVAPIPWLLPDLPAWVISSILLCAGIAVGVFIGLFIAVGRVEAIGTPGERSWFSRFIAGMHVLRSPKRVVLSLATLLVVWAADLGEVMLVSYAVGIHLPIAAGLLILFTLNLAITLPSTPAQVGALEVGALAAMNILQIPSEPALAFALLYHALQVLPLIAAGLALELRLVLGREPSLPSACDGIVTDDALPTLPGARTVGR